MVPSYVPRKESLLAETMRKKAEAKEDRRAAMSEALQLAGVNAGSGMTAQQAKEFVIKPVQVMIDGVMKKLTEVRDTSTASQAGEAAAAPEDGYTWGGQSGRSVPEGFTLSHSVVHPPDPNKIFTIPLDFTDRFAKPWHMHVMGIWAVAR